MTTIELLAYCQAQQCIPDLIWQREKHRNKNLGFLRDNIHAAYEGYHDMRGTILGTRSWLIGHNHTYETVLFETTKLRTGTHS